MTTWKLEDAKNQFSRMFAAARDGSPQRVTRRGADAVVVVREEDWKRLTERSRRPVKSMLDALRASPLADVELDLARAIDPDRAIEL
jgi:prevent-host-death family protein